jgi:hypothetical protein
MFLKRRAKLSGYDAVSLMFPSKTHQWESKFVDLFAGDNGMKSLYNHALEALLCRNCKTPEYEGT